MDICLLFLRICWIFIRVACFLWEFERALPFYHVLKQPHISLCTSTHAHVALITARADFVAMGTAITTSMKCFNYAWKHT